MCVCVCVCVCVKYVITRCSRVASLQCAAAFGPLALKLNKEKTKLLVILSKSAQLRALPFAVAKARIVLLGLVYSGHVSRIGCHALFAGEPRVI